MTDQPEFGDGMTSVDVARIRSSAVTFHAQAGDLPTADPVIKELNAAKDGRSSNGIESTAQKSGRP